MAARVQVVIEAKDAASGVLRGITGQFGDMGNLINELTSKNVSWGNVAEMATTMVVNGLKESYNAAQQYSQAVRDLALVSGTGAEESSRLLQVLDDFQITAEDVTAATRNMTKNGLTPTIDTLAKLSDQYLAIQDPMERNEFILKNLGRAGIQWTNALSQGGDALRAMGNEVSANLILTDQQIKEMEQARLAQDAWNDSIEGTKIAIGSWIGAMIAANTETRSLAEQYTELTGQVVGRGSEAFERFSNEMEKGALMTQFFTTTIEENSAAVEENTTNYQSLIGSITGAQKAIDNFKDTQTDLQETEKELTATRAKLLVELAKTEKAYGANSKAAQELRGKIDGIDKDLSENSKAVAANEEAYKRWAAETVYAFALARAGADGSISTLEGEVLIEAGAALGLFDEKTADAMKGVNESFDSLDTTNAQAVIANLQDQLATLVSQPYIITIQTNTTGVDSFGDAYDDAGWVPGMKVGGDVYAGNPITGGKGGQPSPQAGTSGVNYFYGPVTLFVSASEAATIMETR